MAGYAPFEEIAPGLAELMYDEPPGATRGLRAAADMAGLPWPEYC